jgi:hypothetical protein
MIYSTLSFSDVCQTLFPRGPYIKIDSGNVSPGIMPSRSSRYSLCKLFLPLMESILLPPLTFTQWYPYFKKCIPIFLPFNKCVMKCVMNKNIFLDGTKIQAQFYRKQESFPHGMWGHLTGQSMQYTTWNTAISKKLDYTQITLSRVGGCAWI